MRNARPAGIGTQTILLLEIAFVTGARWFSTEPWASMGDAVSILALVALLVTVIVRWQEIWALAADIRRKRRMVPTALMIIFAIGFVASFVWAQWPDKKMEAATRIIAVEEPPRAQEAVIASNDQPQNRSVTVGGDVNAPVITGDNNTINEAPAPQLEFLGSQVSDIGNGYFRHRVRLNVKSPYPMSQLFLNVRAPGARNVNISPNRTGVVLKGHSGNREDASFDTLMQPHGITSVVFEAKTNDIRTIHFDYNFGDPE